MKKSIFAVLAFFISSISFANTNGLNIDDVVSKFKPESQAIIRNSEHLTMEKLADIINIEAGDKLIGVKNGIYVPLKNVSSQKRSEVNDIDSMLISSLIKIKYRNDVEAIKYLDIGTAIRNLYDDSEELERIKNKYK